MHAVDIFQLVKQVNVIDVINYYQIAELKQRGGRWLTRCPIHDDHSPSFVIFSNGRWKCFGCGEYGDVTDLVAKVFNLTLIEAARMIARDFGIEVDRLLTPAVCRKAIKEAALEAKKREKLNKAVETLSLLVRTINNTLVAGGYQAHYDFAELAIKVDYYEYLIECLLNKNTQIQMMALNSYERLI